MSGDARAMEPEDVTRLVVERLNAGDDLALTSTRSADNTGVRVQVLRRQPDGSWLRIIDRPEVQ